MGYNISEFEEAVEQFGEVFFVLESDREYQVHGKEGYEVTKSLGGSTVRVEGQKDDEWVVAEFPLDAIEHHYTHKEV